MTDHTQTTDQGRGNDRRFAVSANREAARHRLRYVESGGASVDTEECSFCQSSPELDWEAKTVVSAAEKPSEGSARQGDSPDND
ncbi:hypothetical protein [Marinobacter zhanjiangensis]|uniref:Uncharacterized protein n=1 Tax=Marinobacter zhanjiangensis TaxID=578215 RepID=A0ABQ3B7J7_9GAMM|nr:hypothetical protein [Marinobacter zhanjiangensis]GGY82067.1 hypothetical protein GCM10007071_31790 [Marinobacter zhanjiangensis]